MSASGQAVPLPLVGSRVRHPKSQDREQLQPPKCNCGTTFLLHITGHQEEPQTSQSVGMAHCLSERSPGRLQGQLGLGGRLRDSRLDVVAAGTGSRQRCGKAGWGKKASAPSHLRTKRAEMFTWGGHESFFPPAELLPNDRI